MENSAVDRDRVRIVAEIATAAEDRRLSWYLVGKC